MVNKCVNRTVDFPHFNGHASITLISTILPEDFGSNSYYERQKELVSWHIGELGDIEWLFDYWLGHSYNLRQYLWAPRDSDVLKAKDVIRVLGLEDLKKAIN